MAEFDWAAATPAARRAHWAAALRSGKYEQTQGFLHTNRGFCCLGVLCDLAVPNSWDDHISGASDFIYLGDSWDTNPPESILEQVGLTDTEANALAEINDNGHDFAEIAAEIEERFR